MKHRPIHWRIVLAAIIITLTILVATCIWFNTKIKAYKPQLAAAMTTFLGVETLINGDMRFGWLKGPTVILKDIELTIDKQPFTSIEQLKIGLDLLPLLYGAYHINSITLIAPRVMLVHDQQGMFNVHRRNGSPMAISTPAQLNETIRYSIKHAAIRYSNQQQQQTWQADNINVTADASWNPGYQFWYQRLSLNAQVDTDSIRSNYLRMQQLRMHLNGERGQFVLVVDRARAMDGQIKATLKANYSTTYPAHEIHINVTGLDVDQSLQTMGRAGTISGKVNLRSNLRGQGKTRAEIIQSLDGEFELKGKQLKLETVNLDKVIDQYQKSQRFNLIDIGAYFFVGPLGAIATKSYDFAGIQKAGLNGKGQIQQMISSWNIKGGIANVNDVAFTTKHHRVALKGKININSNKIEQLKLAVIDAQGCPLLSQQITGNISDPKLKATDKVSPIIGPVVDILRIPGKIIGKQRCQPFYTGSLPHPNG